ncbi:MAG: hypothetical protein EBZ48_14585 [Proteobacteria bacterium]|nr:hypothetical protein [Pseudomonadota bacterium]
MDSFKRSGVTESDRQSLLRQQAKEFHNILSFGRLDAAAPFMEEELRVELLPKLTKALKTDKFVDHAIEDIRFEDDSRRAVVSVNAKIFRNTDFLLKDHTLTEQWIFHTGGSWRLASYESTQQVK